MLKKIVTYLKYGNRFCGLEISTKNEQEVFYTTLLKPSKKELLVDGFFESDTIKTIIDKLPKNQHMYLVLNNDKVLSKTIKSDQQDGLKLAYEAFPNINLDEFYYEVLSQDQNHHIALCRKDYIEDIIKKISDLKISVIAVSLGNTIIGSISSFVNNDSVYSSNAKITLNVKKVIQIEKTETPTESYDINGLHIKSEQLLSFSGALQTLLNTSNTSNNFSEKQLTLKEDFKQTRIFSLFLKAGGFFILGLLLINFFFFNHYFNTVEELKQLSEVNQSNKEHILSLDEVVSKKKKMVDDLLKSSGSKSSYYSNEVVHSLPNSILLKIFNYQPLTKRIKENKDIELNANIISIEGTSSNSKAFSDWINILELKDWIVKTEILDYHSISSKVSDFKIEISLNND